MPTTTTVINTGIMNRQQAEAFLRLAQEQTVLLKEVRTKVVNHPKGQIDRIAVGERLLRKAGEAATPPAEVDPSFSKVDYDTVKVMLRYSLTREAIEDNIERQGLVNTVTTMFAKQFGIDLETLGCVGDAANTTDPFVGIDDGWVKIAQNSAAVNTYDNAGAGISKEVFSGLIKALPNKYRTIPGLSWIMSPNTYENYKDYLTNRATPAGDQILVGSSPDDFSVRPRGIPVITPPAFPDTEVWLTYPKNLIFVVQRDITVRSTQVSDDVLDLDLYAKWNMTARIDFVIEQPEAIARVINL